MIYDLSNRGNNCCGSAQTSLCEIFQLVFCNLALFHFQSQVLFCNIHQRTTGYRRKNTVGLRSYYLAILGHKDEVSSTSLLNIGSGSRIKIHILIESLIVSIYNVVKAHCIVKTGFDISGSMRCCTVHIRYTDSDRLCTALEVRSNRCYKDTELILSCRFYTDNRIDSKHIRTNIQRSSTAIRRNISCICFYYINNSLHETILRKYRHLKSFCRICHTFCIQVRAEGHDSSILSCIGFDSLKTGLCILKYTCTLAHGDHRIIT